MNINKKLYTRVIPSLFITAIAVGEIFWELNNIAQITQLEEKKAAYFTKKQQVIKQQIVSHIKNKLQSDLEIISDHIMAAEKDPFLDDSEYLLFRDQKQILPRSMEYFDRDEIPIRTLYTKLLDTEPILHVTSQNTPWARRGNLLAELKLTIGAQHPDISRLALMDILTQIQIDHDQVLFNSTHDLAFIAAIASYLVKHGQPMPAMMTTILRGGVTSIDGKYIFGLQQLLLISRARLTKRDFEFFYHLITTLCDKYHVEYSRFTKLAKRKIVNYNFDVNNLSRAVLSHPQLGDWYLAQQNDDVMIGHRINLVKLFSESVDYLRSIDVLDFPVNIQLAPTTQTYYAPENINISIDAESWVISNKVDSSFRRIVALGLILFLAILIYLMALQIRSQKYLAMKNDFIAAVSHDLKTPLSAIHLLSESLVSRLHNNKDVKDYPDKILENSKRLRHLTENILLFYGLDETLKKPLLRKLSLDTLLKDVVSFSTCASGISLHIETRGQLDTSIQADRELLTLVFNNLISNSCKHNDNNSVKILINVRLDRTSKNLIISISDNGRGIPLQNWQNAFIPNYKCQQVNTYFKQSSGIGLSLCNKIMMLHRGSIKIAHSDKNGTTIILLFPQS